MSVWLTICVLIWPVLAIASLYVISRAVYIDVKRAKKEGRDLV